MSPIDWKKVEAEVKYLYMLPFILLNVPMVMSILVLRFHKICMEKHCNNIAKNSTFNSWIFVLHYAPCFKMKSRAYQT